ncbi:MAG: hypothetical protein ABJB04_08100 [Betaproteobacteria bacterium]
MSLHPAMDPADPVDPALSALYRAHRGDAHPGAVADRRIHALARAALVARPAAGAAPASRAAETGWRSWLNASWFKPGLAFATLASLSVVIVALMPRDDLDIERAEPPATASPIAPKTAGSPAAASAESAVTAISAAPPALAKAQTAASPSPAADAARAASRSDAMPTGRSNALLAAKTKPEPALERKADATSSRNAASVFVAPQPNPFPAQASSARRASKAIEQGGAQNRSADASTEGSAASAAAPQRTEKPSLLSEPSDVRAGNQPLPEVRDSVPAYPNEFRSSIPLPGTYVLPPRPQVRENAGAAAAGNIAGLVRSPAAAARKEESLQKRSFEGPPSMASTAPPPRDPAEWIKIILKLRAEGKTEQVTKELAEFRKLFPAYQLPDELKPLAAAK